MSTATTLRVSLKRMTDELATLIAGIPVQWYDRHSSSVIVVCPDFYWHDRNAEQSNIQLKLNREFENWFERLKISFKNAPDNIQYELDEAENAYRIWVELDSNWSLTADKAQNERNLRKAAAAFDKILNVLDAGKNAAVIVVPDTNAIIKEPDPAQYRALIGSDAFTFLLLPTVLSELDKLKNLHRNPDFREKAEKTITRIKGWRKQGSLSAGVVVDKSIQVRALHNEPNMKATLSWLDAEVLDDRMVASILEVQSAHAADRVILVTGDINLQNKADAAAIEYLELP
jgi:PIN domain